MSIQNLSSPQRDCVHKRWTLNMLIQGAASHIHLTAAHLVRETLEELQPGLTDLYQRFALVGQLNYLCGDLMLLQGWPNKWYGMSSTPRPLIADHPVFARHANDLVRAESRAIRKLGRQKGVRMIPVLTPLFLQRKVQELEDLERPHRSRLEHLAKTLTRDIIGIPWEKLHASLSRSVAFGNIPPPDNFMTEFLHQCAAGFSGVVRDDDQLAVVARAWVFPLLVHELVKGSVELICLHGMIDWDEETYRIVMSTVDRLDHETICIQAGPELWRRLLAALPPDAELATALMRIAMLEPEPLHGLINDVITAPDQARRQLERLAS